MDIKIISKADISVTAKELEVIKFALRRYVDLDVMEHSSLAKKMLKEIEDIQC